MGLLYLGNACSDGIRAAMSAGMIGCMITPAEGKMPPPGAQWAADNGKFGKGYPGDAGFLRWLDKLRPGPLCRFVIAPDVPFDAAGTLGLYPHLAPAIRAAGFPVGLAGQNGMESMSVPWDDVDVICLGGDTAWKTGLGGANLARQALERGKPVHMLRANSYKRVSYAAGLGCSTADGTFLTAGPDKNLPQVLEWSERIEREGLQGVLI